MEKIIYIKTKDGIHKVECVGNKSVFTEDNSIIFAKSSIIASSDKIENLCDKFIYVSKLDSYKRTYNTMEHLQLAEQGGDPEFYTIYGAILVDEKPKYVAKMNGQGTFELIEEDNETL